MDWPQGNGQRVKATASYNPAAREGEYLAHEEIARWAGEE
jgi:hypothetical protein